MNNDRSHTSTPQVRYVTFDDDVPQRIDNFLQRILKGVPKSLIYKILRKGEVRVNKKRVKPLFKLSPGDEVRIPPIREAENSTATDFSTHITDLLLNAILYEDDNILAINKPAGIPVHGGTGLDGGAVDILRLARPDLKRLELAHRIDKATSGCLLMAKNRSTLNVLHDYFRQGQIKKTYLALTQGQWQKRECLVEAPLLKNQLRSGERMVHVSRDGKKSITQFYPIAVYPTASLVQVALKTGRTHQIRVHSQYRKHPIAGDEKYGDKAFNQQMKQFGLKRLFLHAKQLEFILPGQTERLRIKAELDPALQAVINQLEKA